MVLTTTKVVPATAGRQRALGPGQHGVDLLVVDDGHDHDVGGPGHLGRRCGDRGVPGVALGRLGPDVRHDQGEPGGMDTGGHTVADGAQPDHPDRRVRWPVLRRRRRCVLFCVTLRSPPLLDKCLDYSMDT